MEPRSGWLANRTEANTNRGPTIQESARRRSDLFGSLEAGYFFQPLKSESWTS